MAYSREYVGDLSVPDELKDFFYVRHGATDANARAEIAADGTKRWEVQGSTDNPLNELGIIQALVAGFALRETSFKRLVCSPRLRARQTAELSNIQHGEFIVDARLGERDYGPHEGTMAPLDIFRGNWEGCEPSRDFSRRVVKGLEHACMAGTIFFSHGAVLRVIACVLGVELEEDHLRNGMPLHFQRHGAVWKVRSPQAVFYLAPSQDVEPYPVLDDLGPTDLEFSLHSCQGFKELVKEYGLPVTFFFHVETLEGHKDMIRAEREAGGVAHGLHSHPWKDACLGYDGKLSSRNVGGLPETELRALLAWSTARWKHLLGFRPEGFRSGNLSGSPTIFRVLEECAFTWASCSAPGRFAELYEADWRGATLDPHRTSATSHLVPGEQQCVEVPPSMDTSVTIQVSDGSTRHPDLAPELSWEAYGVSRATTIRNIARRMLTDKPKVAVFTLVAHNGSDYSAPDEPDGLVLRSILDELFRLCGSWNIVLKGATIQEIAELIRYE